MSVLPTGIRCLPAKVIVRGLSPNPIASERCYGRLVVQNGPKSVEASESLARLVGYIRDQHHVIGYRSSRKRQRLAVPRNGEGERLVCFEESQLPGSAAVDWLTPEVGHSVPTLNKHYGA